MRIAACRIPLAAPAPVAPGAEVVQPAEMEEAMSTDARLRQMLTLHALLIAMTVGAMSCAGHAPHPSKLRDADSTEASDRQTRGRDRPGTSIGSRQIAGTGGQQVEEVMAGRFAGVRVMRVPGGMTIRIRESGSVNGSGEPLYVVDGTPIEPGPGGLLFLNPDDVARIEILKDIGATSLYGVRGANGVVLITTKRRP
jgi:TonB-dependent SusC/RagA subfamily outer membrane receptor